MICSRHLQTNTFQGDSAYSPRIFEEVLQAHFFSKPRSFGWSLVERFTSSLPDKPDEKEIPAAMLALVSTAVSLTIMYLWRSLIFGRYLLLSMIIGALASRLENSRQTISLTRISRTQKC